VLKSKVLLILILILILIILLPILILKGHAVVVVAEGAGEELLGQSTEIDAGGNRKLPPIGDFLKSKIIEYFKKHKEVILVVVLTKIVIAK
jgi:hypothetical protein